MNHMDYFHLDNRVLKELYEELELKYNTYKNQNLQLDMSRGKPSLNNLNYPKEC